MADNLFSDELLGVLTDREKDFLKELAPVFEKYGKTAQEFQLAHNLIQEITKLEIGRGVYLEIGGAFFELRRLDPCLDLSRCRVLSCIKCPPPPNWHCCP